MYQRISGFVLAVLIVGTLVWGQCATCPLMLQVTEKTHDCCPQPPPSKDCHKSPDCPGESVAATQYVKSDAGLAVSIVPVLTAEVLPAPAPLALPATAEHASPPAGSPDLFLLHSVLLV